MKTLVLMGAISVLGLVSPALADEVIIERDRPVEVAPPPPPPAVVVEPRERGCATETTRRDDGAGNSETVTRRDCD